MVVGLLVALVAGWLALSNIRGCGTALSPKKVSTQGAVTIAWPEVDDSQIAPKDLEWLKAEPGRNTRAMRAIAAGLDEDDYRVDSGERQVVPFCRERTDERKTQAGIVLVAALIVGVGGALAFKKSEGSPPPTVG